MAAFCRAGCLTINVCVYLRRSAVNLLFSYSATPVKCAALYQLSLVCCMLVASQPLAFHLLALKYFFAAPDKQA
jgi:hypothetical protein